MSKTSDPTYIPNQVDPQPGATDPIPGGQAAQTARKARGQRTLSERERAQRQLALQCTVADKNEAMLGCTQVLHYAVFFDGTGNNRDQEMAKSAEKRALSNIAKLFDAHKDERPRVYRDYVPGVGTPYADIGDTGGSLGMAIGKHADDRVNRALQRLDEVIAQFPADVKILLIDVTVFGFSRGAAQARAFMRELAVKCEAGSGSYSYKGKPIRVAFAGLFDTVCSAYGSMASAAFSSNGGHNGWAHDMKLPAMVEQTAHMIAAHEVRRRFPLDSTRIDAAYPENTVEVWYPGVHSDVGGGYAPGDQGRENTISRFALNEMYDVAFEAGVLFRKLDKLPPEVSDEFNKDDPQLREVFNAYIDAVPLKRGRMEEVGAAHMELLQRWLKERVGNHNVQESMKRLRAREKDLSDQLKPLERRERELQMQMESQWNPAPSTDSMDEYRAVTAEANSLRKERSEVRDYISDLEQEDVKLDFDVAMIERKKASGQKLTLREETILRAWEARDPLPQPVRKFFDLFAHDSVAHFDYDTSRLSDWRTVFFGDTKYKPS